MQQHQHCVCRRLLSTLHLGGARGSLDHDFVTRSATPVRAIASNDGMSRWITASEIRLAMRLIAKQPVLSLTIVLALATGVCLATIGFTLRDGMLYSSLPFANGD